MDTGASEQDLIRAAQRNPADFGPLYDRYVQPVYGFIYRRVSGDTALTQDLTASTFEKALRGLPGYRWQGVSFGAWIFRIARNEIAQHHRRRRSELPLNEDSDAGIDLALAKDVDLARGFAQLSADDRELLLSRFFDELSTPMLAAVLGISPNALYVRLHRALERLRRALRDAEVSDAD